MVAKTLFILFLLHMCGRLKVTIKWWMMIVNYCDWSGRYDIVVAGEKVGEYIDQGSFGELALMYNMPRAATIIATSDGKLWAMVTFFIATVYWLCLIMFYHF